jgi:4a-hydroxytetrahydrobiopterin dehydratase
MVMSDLAKRACKACNKQTPRLQSQEEQALLRQLPGWQARDERLTRRFVFADFVVAMRFVDEMARIAEAEGHHPRFTVDYDKVDVELWTHTIDALSENDFILAAKLDVAATAVAAQAARN